MKQTEVLLESLAIRNSLKSNNDFAENRIVDALEPVPPFQWGGDVKTIIIGQDPTIRNELTRRKIKFTLNLDKEGALKRYLSTICSGLGVQFENLYATNIFKYFYTVPPANTINVLKAHLNPNFELLKKEVSEFPDAKIITLGEPVLQLLTDENIRVRQFWGYDKKSGESNKNFSFCKASENKLKRDFYPFPHQPSVRKQFYKLNLEAYIEYMKNQN